MKKGFGSCMLFSQITIGDCAHISTLGVLFIWGWSVDIEIIL